MKLKLVEVFNNILEGSYDDEGVADKLYPNFRVPTGEPNRKVVSYIEKEGSQPVAKVTNVLIFKNPKNLNHFAGAVRAIGDIKGNIYVAQHDGHFVHWDMADALGITLFTPQGHDLLEDENIMRLMRLAKSDTFVNLSNCNDRDHCMKILDAMRHRNPQYKYLPRW
jgi:GTP:adenosylcobinamide-phosphate guanylyltransferase